MNTREAEQLLVEAFLDVAPDADLTTVAADAAYREALGIDSMDFLAILEEVAKQTGVEIPEADYPKIETFGGFVSYLCAA